MPRAVSADWMVVLAVLARRHNSMIDNTRSAAALRALAASGRQRSQRPRLCGGESRDDRSCGVAESLLAGRSLTASLSRTAW